MTAPDSNSSASSTKPPSSISQETQSQYQDDISSPFVDDCDLKLWLQHTGFFDIEHRQKVLGSFRKLKAIDEQRSKIIDEIRTLEYFNPPMLLQSSTTSESSSPLFAEPGKPEGFDYNAWLSSRSAVFATSGERCDSVISSMKKGAGSDTWSMTFRERPSSNQQDTQDAQPSIEATTSLDIPDDARQEDESPSSLSLERSPEGEYRRFGTGRGIRNYTPSEILSLAPKQESRYFLVKSFNMMNVDMSQRDGLWITKMDNGALFDRAFQDHKNVFLIFSVNKSKAFQGYARMTSAPSTSIPPARWMSNISWEASAPFRVQWLSTRRTEFWKLGDLKNPFNDGKPVFVGRDGQEFPEACGRKMVRILGRGSTRERSSASSWMMSKASDHENKDEMPVWRHDEHSEAGEDDSVNTESGLVGDMPLIEY